MSAGEIRHRALAARPESASLPVHGAWAGMADAAAGKPARQTADDGPAAALAACLAEDDQLSAEARHAIEALLRRHRALEEELARQRKLLQEWIVSQLTYKALYYQYSGQSPQAPRLELMREKDAVRRRIQEQFDTDARKPSGTGEAGSSLSRP